MPIFNLQITFVDQRAIPLGLVGGIQELIHAIHVGDVDDEHSTDDTILEDDKLPKFDDSATVPLNAPIAIIWRVKVGEGGKNMHSYTS